MDPRIVYEIIGYVGSALVVISLTMQSLLRLRVVNLVGAAVFTVYGVLIEAPPIWLVNGVIVLIDLYHLRRMLASRSREEYFEVLEVSRDSEYLESFLAFHADEIARFQPEFDGLRDDHRALFVLRDMVPAGLVVLREGSERTAIVDLDFVIGPYRDFRPGAWVYGESGLLTSEGFTSVLAAPGNDAHRRYLERLGFSRERARFRLDLPA